MIFFISIWFDVLSDDGDYSGEIYAEMFIQGREFTVLVTGDERTGAEVR